MLLKSRVDHNTFPTKLHQFQSVVLRGERDTPSDRQAHKQTLQKQYPFCTA